MLGSFSTGRFGPLLGLLAEDAWARRHGEGLSLSVWLAAQAEADAASTATPDDEPPATSAPQEGYG